MEKARDAAIEVIDRDGVAKAGKLAEELLRVRMAEAARD